MKYDKLFMALLGASAAHGEASRQIFNDYGLTESQPKIHIFWISTKELARRTLHNCAVSSSLY